MTVATLIAVRPILVDGRKLPPGSLFTVDAEHAPALLATGEAATSPIAAASYGVIYPIPPAGAPGVTGRPRWPHGVSGLLDEP